MREEPVSGLDVLKTLAEFVGVDASLGNPATGSFAKLLLDPEAEARQSVLSASYSRHGLRYVASLATWWNGWKGIYRIGDPVQLFRIEEDPLEELDLAEERPVLAGFLAQRIRELSGFNPRMGVRTENSAPTVLDDATREQLVLLGYLDDE